MTLSFSSNISKEKKNPNNLHNIFVLLITWSENFMEDITSLQGTLKMK